MAPPEVVALLLVINPPVTVTEPDVLSMAPPEPLAELLAKVVLVSVSVPSLEMAPPATAELLEKVLSRTVAVPLLSSAPPWPLEPVALLLVSTTLLRVRVPLFSMAPPVAALLPVKAALLTVSVPSLTMAPPLPELSVSFWKLRFCSTTWAPASTWKMLPLFWLPSRVIGKLGALPSMVITALPVAFSSRVPWVSLRVELPRLGSRVMVSEMPLAASALAAVTAWRRDNSLATAVSVGLLTTRVVESNIRSSSTSRKGRKSRGLNRLWGAEFLQAARRIFRLPNQRFTKSAAMMDPLGRS